MRGWIFFTFLLLCGLNCFSLEKEEYLYLTSTDDSLSGSLITLSTAYINENPQRATLYNAQAINQTNKLNFKAYYLLQNSIIYNFYYSNKSDSALKNILKAQEIYKEINQIEKVILCDIIKGAIFEKIGDSKRALNEYRSAYETSKKIKLYEIAFISRLAQFDLSENTAVRFPVSEFSTLVQQIENPSIKGYAFLLINKRRNALTNIAPSTDLLDSAQNVYASAELYIQEIDVIIQKARLYEKLNNVEKVIQLNELIYQKSITHNYGNGLIFSCHKLSDFFESINEFEWANIYLRYLNQIKTAEGEKELAERVLLAEKEKKMDLERMISKNKLKFQSYLVKIGFGIAFLILAVAVYILIAYRTKSKLATDLLLAYNKNEELKKEKDNFLAYTSHEIRTPLSAVLTTSELLKKSNLNKKQNQLLDTLKNSASNILFLVNDILDLSKLEQRKISLEKKPFAPKKVISETINILKSKALANNVTIQFNSTIDDSLNINGDDFRFQQIMLNLIDNAIKFSPDGIVKVELDYSKNEKLLIKVIDNGIGINKKKIKEIFNPYSQEKTNTSRQYGGTGLGLAICDQIIRLMAGEINVVSNSKGSTFIVKIPVQIASKEVIEDEIVNKVDLKKIGILIVEDDELNGKLFKDLIKSQYVNANVDWVKNGIEAIERLLESSYDIILMDIEMPLKNGYETSIAIRNTANQPFKNIPIIGMTAHIIEDVVEKCYASGMNDCISKPFQLDALVNKINNLCKLETKVNSDNEFNSNEKYIKIFSTNFIDDLKKLEKCEKNNDTEGVLSLLHKIKGSSFTMGYESLGNAISQMEQKKLVDLELLEKLFHQSINQK